MLRLGLSVVFAAVIDIVVVDVVSPRFFRTPQHERTLTAAWVQRLIAALNDPGMLA